MLTMLLGQKAGYKEFPCFLCLWDIRPSDLHWTKTDWSLRGVLTPGGKKFINTTLVPPENVLLPPIHIKLGLMKQFIKSPPKYGECFRYLCSKFPKLSEAKLKEGVFASPDIRKLLSDSLFSETMGTRRKKRGTLLRMQCIVFEDTKDLVCKTIVQRMLAAYEAQGCKMSLKVHFLHSHIVCFPENLEAYSEEQVE
ncbi:hypothetical protein AVEN_52494-1 [Araneus ventricosus]|uniref:Uncharacterized protein n=1 Tax=Araneus ventricosus TaxID=182803 RepID=A0A4Y2VHY7_ARAVE|nr:hypothetical protein AVEN_52494-1 [Araneus ventricosus]